MILRRFFPPLAVAALICGMTLTASPLLARESLGVYSGWGAFRDREVPRCYAIAKPGGRARQGFASVGTWPRRQVRGQVHFRLSRAVGANARITLRVGTRSFVLTGAGRNAWASDRRMDAAIVAAMRSAAQMSLRAPGLVDSYALDGAATAMDAATLACARLR